MYRMTILYGTPTDPEAFRRYYTETHVPLARKMQGLTGWNLQWTDGNPDWILVAELYAEDKSAMDAVLASPEGVAASKDLDNFVTGGVVFLTGEEEQVAFS
ncbi:EthD family reductase [Pseudonocardia adelaidensis]|uniref:EthD family reductase n=2 Tax=Pseudonocardia adelaidensis TaxID=648754 RepID=A0ABP9NZ72_9PSEU